MNSEFWWRVVGVAMPLIVAMAGGYFTLTNTLARRLDRLKNLSELMQKFPDDLDPNRVLPRIALREMRRLEDASTPFVRIAQRFVTYVGMPAGVIVTISLVVLMFTPAGLDGSHSTGTAVSQYVVAFFGVGLLLFFGAMFIYMKFGPDRHHWVYHWRGDLLRRQGEHHRYWKTIDDHAQDRADEVWKEMVRRRAETR